ncbi:aspartate kinase [Halobacillus mangrovi]|uniref:Aspartokinase n=1 Tax=Halobacillus mangrovi TaxID=402384 RepID=A0A1W5ZTI3_9BACI|nr:aspartate kinase [Halobacillus mangrovi]ARI76616.1 aspartate kinase [Halobacillus mangrovi]
MTIVVQKYGGTSLSTTKRIKEVTERILEEKRKGNQVVVVVSAMGSSTDSLVEMSKDVSSHPDPREMDMLLSTGEQVTSSLVALALRDQGADALSLTGEQAGIHTEETFGDASISFIDTPKIKVHLDENKIVVVAGFQGVSEKGEICTLGRGGSDTTAASLAAELHADRCEIFTDVEGVFTADPRVVKEAKKIPELTYKQMQDLADMGAGVVHPRAVLYAYRNNVPLFVRSSFDQQEGTRIDHFREQTNVTGIAVEKDLTCVTIIGKEKTNLSEEASAMIKIIEAAGIAIRRALIIEDRYSFSFIIQSKELKQTYSLLQGRPWISKVSYENRAAVSIVFSHERLANVSNRLGRILMTKRDRADIIFHSPRVWRIIVPEYELALTAQLLHDAFIEKPNLSISL